jgi:hypothetical protein
MLVYKVEAGKRINEIIIAQARDVSTLLIISSSKLIFFTATKSYR